MKTTVTITRIDLAAKNAKGIKSKTSGTAAKHRDVLLAADVVRAINRK